MEIKDFEILRKSTGAIALSFNAGVLSQSPDAIRVEGDAIEVLSETGSLGWLKDLPVDVLNAANSHEGLLVVEFATAGIVHSAQMLRNVDLPPVAVYAPEVNK